MSPRRRLLLVVVLSLALVGALAAAYRLIVRESRTTPAQDQPGPVLLVPGYGGGAGSLTVLADRIRATGRDARVVALPGDGTGDLVEQAGALDKAVDQALDRALDKAPGDAPSVDVIGFSAGGVVARLWVQRHDGAHKARRVITLGSPHHGAKIAAAGAAVGTGACPAACQQLAPGSRLLASLTVPVPNPPMWLAVLTLDDETVTPVDSARLEGAVNVVVQSLCPSLRVGHGGLPTDPLVTSVVLAAIGPSPLAAPSPGCVSS